MKKIIKNPLLTFILGLIISGTVVYAYVFYAQDISYDNSYSHLVDENDNNVTNVQDALDILYDKAFSNRPVSYRINAYGHNSAEQYASNIFPATHPFKTLTIDGYNTIHANYPQINIDGTSYIRPTIGSSYDIEGKAFSLFVYSSTNNWVKYYIDITLS